MNNYDIRKQIWEDKFLLYIEYGPEVEYIIKLEPVFCNYSQSINGVRSTPKSFFEMISKLYNFAPFEEVWISDLTWGEGYSIDFELISNSEKVKIGINHINLEYELRN